MRCEYILQPLNWHLSPSNLLQPTVQRDASLWTLDCVNKLSLVSSKHTHICILNEGHVVKSLSTGYYSVRPLSSIQCMWLMALQNNCCNTHHMPDTDLWPVKVCITSSNNVSPMRHSLTTKHSSKATCLWPRDDRKKGPQKGSRHELYESQVVVSRGGQPNTKAFSQIVI